MHVVIPKPKARQDDYVVAMALVIFAVEALF